MTHCLLNTLLMELIAINGLSMTSGLGSVIGVFFGIYAQQGYHAEEIALLLTLPSMSTLR